MREKDSIDREGLYRWIEEAARKKGLNLTSGETPFAVARIYTVDSDRRNYRGRISINPMAESRGFGLYRRIVKKGELPLMTEEEINTAVNSQQIAPELAALATAMLKSGATIGLYIGGARKTKRFFEEGV